MRYPLPALCIQILLIALAGSPALHAESLREFADGGHLTLSAHISPVGPVVPGQKASLVIEIATDTWFSGGTRISPPEVPGLLVLQTEEFASNATRRSGGKTWVVQRWTLDVFAERAGSFSIPPVRLQLQVQGNDQRPLQGELHTPPTSFSVTLPSELEALDFWLAAPSAEISQQFDRALEGLSPGDAVERHIVIEASDVMAMMLPSFVPQSFDGLASYPAPPVLENHNNRGESSALRSQRISYIAEGEGFYTLPAREFAWWNTQTNELQKLFLPEVSITVGSGAPGAGTGPLHWRQIGLGVLLAPLFFYILYRIARSLPWAELVQRASQLLRQVRMLARPALPAELNPGNNVGDKKAK